MAEHIHRFTQALDVWKHPWYRALGARRPRRLLRVRARADRPAARHRGRLPARPRGPAGEPARRPAVGLRGRLGPLPARRGGGPARRPGLGAWDIWRSHDPEKVWARYFETLGEAARSGHVRHPRPPRPGEGLGRARAAARTATCAASTSARWTGSPSPTWRSRSPPRACASRSAEIYPAAGFLEMCLEAGRPVALSSDAHLPEQLGHEYERARGLARRPRRDASSPSSKGAARRLEPIG